jgi:hypothetical protein
VLGAIAVLALAAALRGVRRSRRRLGPRPAFETGPLRELQRALYRSGRWPAAPTTLDALAGRWRGTAAEAYVRTLASARYGYGDGRPTAAQRAGLRRELGGRGLRRRLRAWWAVPPRPTGLSRRTRP